MVSNKNRKTKYVDISFTEEAAQAFFSCVKGQTNSKAMLKITSAYKKKCPDRSDPGVCYAD